MAKIVAIKYSVLLVLGTGNAKTTNKNKTIIIMWAAGDFTILC